MALPLALPFVGIGGIARVEHNPLALSRLAAQFQGKPLVEAMVAALTAETQAVEDALLDALIARDIETATGAELDLLAALVGQPRPPGADDALLRLYVRARIRVNTASGSPADLLGIFALIAKAGAGLWLREFYPAAFIFELTAVAHTQAEAEALAPFVASIRPAGVYGLLQWSPAIAAETFAFDGGAGAGFADAVAPTSTGGQFAGIIVAAQSAAALMA
jgi:hypothetical protein